MMNGNHPDYSDLAALLRQSRADWLPKVFPNGVTRGKFFFIGNPDGDAGDSLPIPLDDKQRSLADFGGDFSGDDLDLYAAVTRQSLADAAREVAQNYGVVDVGAADVAVNREPPFGAKSPESTARGERSFDSEHPFRCKPGDPTQTWVYYDEEGEQVLVVARYDRPGRKKEFRPWIQRGNTYRSGYPTPRPLYKLSSFGEEPDLPVLVVEGEKTADAAIDLVWQQYVVTTWPGGSGSVSKADWKPVSGRKVIVWPDADAPGRKAGQAVAEACRAAGARSVMIVRVPDGLPEGWDLADPLPGGWTEETVLEMLASAQAPDADDERDDAPRTFTAAELATMTFPPIRYVVDGYIAEGLTLVAGKPKIGKSWLCLDVAVAVACGGTTLGSIEVDQGDVLYLALEDSPRRVHKRLAQILPHGPWPSRLHLSTEWDRLDEGGLEYITRWIEKAENPRLAIVDTLARVRGSGSQRDSLYQNDYRALEGLQRLAAEFNLAIVVVHHVRKSDADDPLDLISGSTGLTAVVDTAMVLARGQNGVTLTGRGRDVEEFEVAMRFEPDLCRWTILGEAEEVQRSDARKRILAVLTEEGGAMGPREIADASGMSDANVRNMLRKMLNDGEVEKVGYGKYARPGA